MEFLDRFLDVFVIVATGIAYFTAPRLGGKLFGALRKVLAGILFLGVAHLTEILLPLLLDIEPLHNEIIHGLLESAAVVFLIAGFSGMRLAFEK